MIMRLFNEEYSPIEDILISDESQLLYVNEISIRAYFYAKMRAKVYTFKDFIDNFVGPDLETLERDLIQFLKQEFGISYRTPASWRYT